MHTRAHMHACACMCHLIHLRWAGLQHVTSLPATVLIQSLTHFLILSFIDPIKDQQQVYKMSYMLLLNKRITDLLLESSRSSLMIWWWQSAIIWSIEKELSEREIKTLLSDWGEGVIRLREADTRIQQEVISAVHSSESHVTEPCSHVNRLFIFPASLIQSQTGRHLDGQLGTILAVITL